MSIFFSQEAEEQLDALLHYLEHVWGERAMFNFLDKLDQSLLIVSEMPNAFPHSDVFPGLYRCVVTRQTSAYYRILDNEIEVVAILDNRQDFYS
jgi:plasmid stabilization system protein ParE